MVRVQPSCEPYTGTREFDYREWPELVRFTTPMKALEHCAELDATILMYREPLHLPALPESPPIREGRLGLTVVACEVPPQRPVSCQLGVAKQWFQCLALQRQADRR